MADNQSDSAQMPLADQAKQQAQQAVQQGQQMVTHAWELGRSQFRSQLTGQKDRLATGLTDYAQVLRQSGNQLREQGQAGSGQIAERAADKITQLSDTMHQKDVDRIVSDTEDFARNRPAVFLGAAALMGFAMARFLKSSGQGIPHTT